jgi:hypothetical protein
MGRRTVNGPSHNYFRFFGGNNNCWCLLALVDRGREGRKENDRFCGSFWLHSVRNFLCGSELNESKYLVGNRLHQHDGEMGSLPAFGKAP